MTVSIPAVYKTIGAKKRMRQWFDRKGTPKDRYFRAVDNLRAASRWLGSEGTPDPDYELLVALLTRFMNKDGIFYDYLAANNGTTEDPQEWDRTCAAAAYVILDRYDQALEKGTWQPTA